MAGGGRRDVDAWCSDGDGDDGDAAALAREAAHRDAVFHAMGYRDGVEQGKAEALQAGFDTGFAAGVSAGFVWGQARGAAETLRAMAALHPAALAAHAGDLAALDEEALRIPAAAMPLVWPDLQRCLLADAAAEAGALPPPDGTADAAQPPPARDAHAGRACGGGDCCAELHAPPAAPATPPPGCGAPDCCGGGGCGSGPAPPATDKAAALRAQAEVVRASLRDAGARLRRLGVGPHTWEALSAKPRSEAAARGAMAALRVAPAEQGEDWGW